jgi:hypothetical protein
VPKSQMEQDLDEMHRIVKHLDGLLSDRQLGLSMWLLSLTDNMKYMKKLLDRIGVK